MKDALKSDSSLSEAINNTAANVTGKESLSTISHGEMDAYKEAVDNLQLEDDIEFHKVSKQFAERYEIWQDQIQLTPYEFFKIFIDRLKERAEKAESEEAKKITTKAKIYEKGQNGRKTLQEWLGTTSDFVQSTMAALGDGHKMYGARGDIATTQSISALKIENLLDIILLIDETLTRESDYTSTWYQDIDAITGSTKEEPVLVDLPALEKVKPILEISHQYLDSKKIEEHTGTLLKDSSTEFQKAFEGQLQNMINRWVAGEEYNANVGALKAVITKPMLDELEKKGFITKA